MAARMAGRCDDVPDRLAGRDLVACFSVRPTSYASIGWFSHCARQASGSRALTGAASIALAAIGVPILALQRVVAAGVVAMRVRVDDQGQRVALARPARSSQASSSGASAPKPESTSTGRWPTSKMLLALG